MIVVTDTSVVLNLCVIGQQALLPLLYGRVLAPAQVVMEFQRLAAADPRFHGLVFPSEIEVAHPADPHPVLAMSRRLHDGEIAALALAVERKASLVLLDDSAGRKAAASLGLRVIGLLGVLAEARTKHLTSALAPLIDRLQSEAGFWISPDLRALVLKAVGESA